MTYRFRSLACLSVGALVIAGCSSTSGPSGPAAAGDAGAGMDAPAQMCAAVSLTPMQGAALFACFECEMTMCSAEVTACSTDCICGPSQQCLQTHGNDYTMCPDAMNALFNTNQALMNLAACASAPSKCAGPCFGNDGG